MSFRVATWNLQRCHPRMLRKTRAQQQRIGAVDADVWVFTETFTTRSPGDDFCGVFSPPHPDRRPDLTERWTGIWSRWPITILDDPTPHRRGTVAARVDTSRGPVIVYGTVIPWQHEREHDDGRTARGWDVHAAEIERQAGEWSRLRDLYPQFPLVVAGDFNQGRSGRPNSYGTDVARRSLTDGLAAAGLRSLTDVDLVASGALKDRSHVEHICVSGEFDTASPVFVWDRVDGDGVVVSDHPTIAVDLERAL